jgi:hypothetical protein
LYIQQTSNKNILVMKKLILERLKQESTWRGLIQLAIACGVGINPSQAASIITVGVSVVGAINVFKKD